MSKWILFVATVVSAVAIIGCDHSTNNQDPPAGSQVTITSPSDESIVDGNVLIIVDVSSLAKVTKIELFVNGELTQARTAPPWQFEWNTSGLPLNSFYTLTTKAYAYGSGYSTSQAVTVRTK